MDLNDIERIDLNALGNTDSIIVNDLTGTDVVEMNINLAGTIGGTAGDGQADTVLVNATNGNDVINVFGAGTSVAVVGLSAQVNVTNAEGANDSLIINGLSGDDVIIATTLPADVMKLTIDGGTGTDAILGSQGADMILGGDGDDFAFGDNGNDLAQMGAGDDVFQWNPGDGNDTIEGQDGTDTMLFFGANVAENIDISANGGRVLFSRNVANVTMDLNDVEHIDFRALGGQDNIVINDLSGTDVSLVAIDLEGAPGSGIGDGQVDQVTVSGTQGDNTIHIAGAGGAVGIVGASSPVAILHTDATDKLTVNGLGGADVIDASGLQAGQIDLTLNGGLGNDVFVGSQGDDLMVGGDGDDVAFMGIGNDVFVWNPGDDNDTVEGQAGVDTLAFNGANIAEDITISANGGRATFFRDIASVTMDTNDTETIAFNALGGADNIVVNDLSGTDVTNVVVNLAGTLGGSAGDGAVDTITINATNGDDVISVSNNNGMVTVSGLAAQVMIFGFEATDQIVINGLAGNDVIEATGLGTAMQFTANGGDGNDVLIGSAGADTLRGDAGDDVLLGGAGLDVLDGGPGNNIVIQDFLII
jgi:Ca2+-binding RTX toxin-like protein